MIRTFHLSLLAILALAPLSRAQEDTAHHREVYARINTAEPSLRIASAKDRFEKEDHNLTGLFEAAQLRKIVAKAADGTVSEFYLEYEAPLFVFRTSRQTGDDGKPGQKIEERLYFKDGEIFKWLTTEKPAPVFHGEDYAATTELLVKQCAAFSAALAKASPAAPAAAGAMVEGVFTGIEEGDYAHWNIRTKDGERSFFILKPDASVEKALKDPKAHIGKTCRVKWKKSTEEIPEAGGKMEIEQIVSVEWIASK